MDRGVTQHAGLKSRGLGSSPSAPLLTHRMTYRITTLDPRTGKYTPQIGVPEYVTGFKGLRRALRKLERLAYDRKASRYAVKVERV